MITQKDKKSKKVKIKIKSVYNSNVKIVFVTSSTKTLFWSTTITTSHKVLYNDNSDSDQEPTKGRQEDVRKTRQRRVREAMYCTPTPTPHNLPLYLVTPPEEWALERSEK